MFISVCYSRDEGDYETKVFSVAIVDSEYGTAIVQVVGNHHFIESIELCAIVKFYESKKADPVSAVIIYVLNRMEEFGWDIASYLDLYKDYVPFLKDRKEDIERYSILV